jgi:serine/threonine protein kinase/formylglycine-generating enzyme required for sulfatase activity/dienelactone hydrolase
MNPERWKKIEQLYRTALEYRASERAAFLTEACDGDNSLRSQVESLLAYKTRAESWIESPAFEIAAKALAQEQPQTAEKYQKIKAVFQAILEVEPQNRAAFLEAACQNDAELRHEVERLLNHYDSGFMEEPVIQNADFPAIVESLQLGQRIGRYEIIKRLGAGGMGEVYLAEDGHLNRKVALKMLAPHLVADAGSRARFLREARLASALDHPNICTIHEICESESYSFISMQYVEGKTLSEVISKQALALESLLSISLQVADALRTAHAQGIIHRDIKSGNILITARGQAKVLDFGLAKSLLPNGEAADVRLTQTGAISGTPAYMSPEQARGERVDYRSDIFSFGVVLYEMVTGRLPFKKKSQAETMNAIINEPHLSVTNVIKETPPELSAVIDKALAKEPEKRYQDIGFMRDDLTAILLETAKNPSSEIIRLLERLKPIPPKHSRGLSNRAKLSAAAVALVIGLLAAAGGLLYRHNSNLRWAEESVHRIEELARQRKFFEAYDIAMQTQGYLPKDETITRLMPIIADEFTLITEPQGANVYVKRYALDANGKFPEREFIGKTPINKLRIARGHYLLYIEKEGYSPIVRTVSFVPEQFDGQVDYNPPPVSISVKMRTPAEVPEGMVFVPGGNYELVSWRKPTNGTAKLGDFLIDKYEVANREYKAFITAGGYLRKEFWKYPFVKDGKPLSFEVAINEFKDRTGLPAPRSWSNQTYPEGKASHPVTDLSWYEAAAYAEFRGKSLPTIFQWEKAARDGFAIYGTGNVFPWGRFQRGDTLEYRANFSGKDVLPVDSFEFGMSPFGNYQMAGNVAEWCRNEITEGFTTAGGSWGEPHYSFGVFAGFPGFYHANTLGFRCVINLQEGEQGGAKIDPLKEIPVYRPSSAADFRSWLSFYRYDKVALDAQVVEVKETDEWRREKISYIGKQDERVLAYLYLPKNFKRPLPVIQYLPGADVFWHYSSVPQHIENFMSPYIKSGYAVFAVVLKGFIEREHPNGYKAPPDSSIKYREGMVNTATDLSRGLDYLETRNDLDHGKTVYWGFSKGAELGLIITAVEKRYCAAVFIGVGIFRSDEETITEANIINFACHITIPKLMVSGRYDEQFSWETEGQPLYKLLSEPKHLERFEGGHTPPPEIAVPIISKWLAANLEKAPRK